MLILETRYHLDEKKRGHMVVNGVRSSRSNNSMKCSVGMLWEDSSHIIVEADAFGSRHYRIVPRGIQKTQRRTMFNPLNRRNSQLMTVVAGESNAKIAQVLDEVGRQDCRISEHFVEVVTETGTHD
jgi:hypothetical protein